MNLPTTKTTKKSKTGSALFFKRKRKFLLNFDHYLCILFFGCFLLKITKFFQLKIFINLNKSYSVKMIFLSGMKFFFFALQLEPNEAKFQTVFFY